MVEKCPICGDFLDNIDEETFYCPICGLDFDICDLNDVDLYDEFEEEDE